MNISKPFINRPVMTTLIMLPLVVFGIFAYKLLPVSAIPFIAPPIIEVTTSYPGASPDEIARLVSGPLERQFMLMQGIQYVTSSNDYEQSTCVLQFHSDIDVNVAATQTQNAISKAMGQLPQDLPNPPTYTISNPSDTPIVFCAIYSNTIPQATLYTYGYTFLGQQLGTIDGIANIETYGFPYAVRVQIDPQALAAKGISLQDVANAINNENPDQPTGKFYGPSASIVTRTNGQLYYARDYEDLIIKYKDNAPVRIRDIGIAVPSVQNNKQSFSWLVKEGDGEHYSENAVVVLAVYKQQGYNTVKVCQDIENLLHTLEKDLPASVILDIPFTQSVFIQEAVNEVEMTLVLAFLLVVVVVFVYLGKIRNSIIPLIALPITITGTFMIMYVMNYSIDIMSMSALTLGIGFLVDDAIVVLENIVRYVQMGESPHRGSLKGSKQIIITVISISLCLSIVFLPLLFMEGTIGAIFHEFAAVMLIAVLFSAFISVSLTPMLCSRFVPPYSQDSKSRMEIISDKLNEKLVHAYKKGLLWALKHKKWMFVLCGLNLVGSVYLFMILPKEFLPPDDLGNIQGFIQTQQGVSPDRMSEYFELVQNIIMQNKYVTTMAKLSATPTDNQGLFFVNLVDPDKRPPIWIVMQEIKEALAPIIGIRVFMKAFPLINLQIGNSTSGKGNYQYILQALDENALYDNAVAFLAALKARPELTAVSSDMLGAGPTLSVDILRDQAHAYSNQNATEIENAFMYTYGETYISKINRPENMYYVILEAKDEYVLAPDQLNLVYLGEDKKQVAIDSVIKTGIVPTQIEINHINTMPSVTVSFDVAPGYALSEAITVVEEVASSMLPSTVIHAMAGNTAAFKQTFKQLTILLIIAIFVIYIILGILYENFIHPITALSALPVAVLGGLLTLVIFRQALSIYAMIGLIMLLGIVMKNGILIIDFSLEEMRENHLSPEDAVIKASVVRFRPIIMTTLAAMMGSVPVALGIGGTVAHGRAPLGMVVVGGLMFSQMVTLFVIPCFFEVICSIQDYCVKRFDIFKEEVYTEEESS